MIGATFRMAPQEGGSGSSSERNSGAHRPQTRRWRGTGAPHETHRNSSEPGLSRSARKVLATISLAIRYTISGSASTDFAAAVLVRTSSWRGSRSFCSIASSAATIAAIRARVARSVSNCPSMPVRFDPRHRTNRSLRENFLAPRSCQIRREKEVTAPTSCPVGWAGLRPPRGQGVIPGGLSISAAR